MSEPLTVLRGTLDVLVLKALTWGPMHGFEITAWIEARATGNLDIVDSALYQSLYRLEARRAINADWGVTENNRRARYYSVTVRWDAPSCETRPPAGTDTPKR
jgi:DNA-binding PadR family transcriptional regulator